MAKSTTTLAPGAAITTVSPDPKALAALDDHPGADVGFCTGTTGDDQLTLLPSILRITYGVGAQSQEGHPQGSFALDFSDMIAKKGEKITVLITGVDKYYKERKDQDDGELPKMYRTADEAKADGQIVDWPPRDSGLPKPSVSPAKTLTMLVRKPDDSPSEKFILLLDGHLYAPVKFFTDKGICKDITPYLDRIQFEDARLRKVHSSQGRHDAKFLTLHTYNQKNRAGRDMTHVSVGPLVENGGIVPVPEAFWTDLKNLMGAAPDLTEDETEGFEDITEI